MGEMREGIQKPWARSRPPLNPVVAADELDNEDEVAEAEDDEGAMLTAVDDLHNEDQMADEAMLAAVDDLYNEDEVGDTGDDGAELGTAEESAELHQPEIGELQAPEPEEEDEATLEAQNVSESLLMELVSPMADPESPTGKEELPEFVICFQQLLKWLVG
jgi:hypothetical protein